MPTRPEATEYAPYYAKYMQTVPADDILDVLRSEIDQRYPGSEPLPDLHKGPPPDSLQVHVGQ